jgi:hypothetical protein
VAGSSGGFAVLVASEVLACRLVLLGRGVAAAGVVVASDFSTLRGGIEGSVMSKIGGLVVDWTSTLVRLGAQGAWSPAKIDVSRSQFIGHDESWGA